MIHGFGLGLGFGGRVPRWTPASLGASLLGWWDAEDASTITTSGSSVSSWRDKVAGYDATQAFGSSRPTYSATGFNNRPGITFDGVDDELTLGSVPFPIGSSASEIWTLIDQQTPGSDATSRRILAYGGTSSATSRAVARSSNSGVSRAQAIAGDGTTAVFPTNLAVDLSGRRVVRGIFSPTSVQADADGVANGAVTTALNSSGGRSRLGANSGTTAGNFFQGGVSALLITAALTTDQADKLYTYLNARKGS